MDVKAVLSSGQKVIIEMQVLNVEGFEKRMLYNAAKAYSTQLKPGKGFDTLEPIIALTITNFVMFPNNDHYASQFKLMKKSTLIEYSDDVQLNFIELPKFTKEESELQTATEMWLFLFKNTGVLESIPENLHKEPEIIKALGVASRANLTPEEDDIQEKRHQFILMQQLAQTQSLQKGKEEGLKEGLEKGKKEGLKEGVEKGIQKGKEEGIKEGIEKGLKKGKEEGVKEGIQQAIIKNATAMLKAGSLSDEQIVEYSGISLSGLDELKASLNIN